MRSRHPGECGFQNLTGACVETLPSSEECSNESNEKLLDIKVGTICWEGEESIIVVISEDLVTQRMLQLCEQSKYKDKLLATVSHDLRTPLNGVIGILELVLETIENVIQRKKYFFFFLKKIKKNSKLNLKTYVYNY